MIKFNWSEILSTLSDVCFGICLGLFIDQVANTGWIFTIIGIAAGIILAIVLKHYRNKEKNREIH